MKLTSTMNDLKMPDHKYLVGLDIGGTKIEATLIEVGPEASPMRLPKTASNDSFPFLSSDNQALVGHILQRQRVPTEREKGYTIVLEKMARLILKICQDQGMPLTQIDHIGLGLPGAIDPQTEQMLNGNTALFIGQDLRRDLRAELCRLSGEAELQTSLRIENDANCFALAEVLAGVGHHYFQQTKINPHQQLGIGIILGTGCGGGMVAHGQLIRGRHGGALEIGHTLLHGNGFSCYCGRVGCAETVLSGTGIAQSYFTKFNEKRSAPEIFQVLELHQQKNKLEFDEEKFFQQASHIIEEYQQYLTQFLVNLTNLFDPDYFVLGGGVAQNSLIYQGLEEKVATQSFIQVAAPKVYQYQLGDSAGVIGAALLAYLSPHDD